MRSITELCGLRVSMETYVVPKGPLQCKRCQRLATHSETADTRPGASHVGALTSPVGALPRGGSLSVAGAGITTRRTTVAVLSGKRLRRLFQSKCPSVSVRAPPRPNPPLRKLSRPGPLPSTWTWARAGITSPMEGMLSRPPPLQPQILIPLLSRSRRCPRSLR